MSAAASRLRRSDHRPAARRRGVLVVCTRCGSELDGDEDRRCTCDEEQKRPRSHLLEVAMTARAMGARTPEAMGEALAAASRALRDESN